MNTWSSFKKRETIKLTDQFWDLNFRFDFNATKILYKHHYITELDFLESYAIQRNLNNVVNIGFAVSSLSSCWKSFLSHPSITLSSFFFWPSTILYFVNCDLSTFGPVNTENEFIFSLFCTDDLNWWVVETYLQTFCNIGAFNFIITNWYFCIPPSYMIILIALWLPRST